MPDYFPMLKSHYSALLVLLFALFVLNSVPLTLGGSCRDASGRLTSYTSKSAITLDRNIATLVALRQDGTPVRNASISMGWAGLQEFSSHVNQRCEEPDEFPAQNTSSGRTVLRTVDLYDMECDVIEDTQYVTGGVEIRSLSVLSPGDSSWLSGACTFVNHSHPI